MPQADTASPRPPRATHRAVRIAVLVCGLAASTGCQRLPAVSGISWPGSHVNEAAAVSAETEASADMPAESVGEPQSAAELAALPEEPVIDDDPEQLMGMGPASLSAFLGAPELIRREFPASVWQYRAEGCVLDVVFYADRGEDRVTYLEARKDGTTKIAPRQCLNKLLRARRAASAG